MYIQGPARKPARSRGVVAAPLSVTITARGQRIVRIGRADGRRETLTFGRREWQRLVEIGRDAT